MPIFEPASGIAAARCVTARTLGITRPDHRSVTTQHPRPCGWCDWPLDALSREVKGFLDWSGYSERSNTYAHHELRVWSELRRDEQERQVVEAQAFEVDTTDVVAIEVAPEPQGQPPEPEEVVAWMP